MLETITVLKYLIPISFFANLTIQELAEQQGVSPITDPSVLASSEFGDEDIDEMLKCIYTTR